MLEATFSTAQVALGRDPVERVLWDWRAAVRDGVVPWALRGAAP